MVKPKEKCCRCRILYRKSSMIKREDGLVCKKCMKKKRKENGKIISNTNYSVIPKSYLPKDVEDKKPKKEKEIEDNRNIKPKLKSALKKIYTPVGGMFLTMLEKQVLYGKYRKQGYTHSEADVKVKERIIFLSDEMSKLRAKGNQSEEDMNIIFKEKFAQLCEQV